MLVAMTANVFAGTARQSKDADQPCHQQRVSGDGDQPVGKVKSNQALHSSIGGRTGTTIRDRPIDPRPPLVPEEVVKDGEFHGNQGGRQPRPAGQRGQHRSAAICTRKPRTPTATKGATRVAAVDLMPFPRAARRAPQADASRAAACAGGFGNGSCR